MKGHIDIFGMIAHLDIYKPGNFRGKNIIRYKAIKRLPHTSQLSPKLWKSIDSGSVTLFLTLLQIQEKQQNQYITDVMLWCTLFPSIIDL